MNKLEQTQKELLKAVTKSNILESELNQIKLMLEGRNTQFDNLFADLMQISEITNNVYIED